MNSDSTDKDESRDTNIDNRKSVSSSKDQKEMKRDNWTKDLYKAVKRINKLYLNDYYGFLYLPNTCITSDIKSRYIKLTKLIHPDKNK